jgi:hypothetical protein
MNEVRKASDILLDLEGKVETSSKDLKTLALSVNILSNRVNQVIELLNALSNSANSDVVMPVVNEMPQVQASIPISSESSLKLDDYSKKDNFPRTQRQETFAPTNQVSTPPTTQSGKVATTQRITDNTGKAIFLANVEITDRNSGAVVYKGRTDGVGKWHASLPVGQHLVHITKSEALNKAKIDVSQNLVVDGSQNVLNLPVMIIK